MLEFVFVFFAVLTLGGALAVLLTRNVLYAAFFLLLTLLGTAALFVLASADFVAVAQLMIYVGGVLVLVIFGVMLTHNPVRTADSQQSNHILTPHRNRWLTVPVAGALFLTLYGLISQANFTILNHDAPFRSGIDTVGRQLMTEYVVPFEIVGVLLLAALIGATYLSAKQQTK
jgi:NADH-quinone oxidoreductase subunit J